MNRTEDILGWRVTADTLEECLARIGACLDGGGAGTSLVCANPHSLEMARRDPDFDRALREADLVVPDGVGIVLASRILGGRIRERITGMDIFLGVNALMQGRGGASCFFLGSSGRTLEGIRARLAAEFPAVRIAGTRSPPFKDEFDEADDRAMIEEINRACPDVLWVGMTAPKQEKWIHRHRARLSARFVGAVGAVFDFYAGTVPRSRAWFREHGLEWLPRLLRQPRRLWRRNFVSNPRFLLRVLGGRLRGRTR